MNGIDLSPPRYEKTAVNDAGFVWIAAMISDVIWMSLRLGNRVIGTKEQGHCQFELTVPFDVHLPDSHSVG